MSDFSFLEMLTDEQRKAVKSQNNVLVSAGAGSGKTKVLTSRVLYNILNGTKLDELLILTFANDAASEMKERVKKILAEYEETASLVPFVDSANITTFDAYFLFLIKKYNYALNISKNVTNLSEDILEVKKDEILRNILDRYYEENNPLLRELINNYDFKGDHRLVNFIKEIDKIISKRKDKYEFIDNYYDNYLSNEALNRFKVKYLDSSISGLYEKVNYLLTFMSSKYQEKFHSKFDYILETNDFSKLIELDKEFDRVPSATKDDDKEIKEKINHLLKKTLFDMLKKLGNYEDLINIDKVNNQKYIPFILNIVKELEIEVDKFKQAKEAYTFNDIALMAKRLLEENEDIREEIKNKTKLIMIDEYQDTSIFQEEFISLISNNNVFVVGDVKQSIYAFRGANPQQFIDKYNLYKKDPTKGTVIDMNTNFRSRQEVNDDINDIFSHIMTLKFGGADYKISHLINTGNDKYNSLGKTHDLHGITCLNIDLNKGDNAEIRRKKELEAIIKDIKSRYYNKMQIYDKETKSLRDIRFSDFTILCSKSTYFRIYEEEFSKNGIPINAVYDENVISDDSIVVLISILKFTNEFNSESPNESNLKHYFVSIARSFLYSYSDEKIYDIISLNKYQNDELYLSLEDFSRKNKGFLINNIFENIIDEFKFFEKLYLINDAISKIKFIKIFYEKTKTMDKLGYTLSDFISYLEKLDELELKMTSRKISSGVDAITLTTMHKSKGLEFPIVYLINLDSKNQNNSNLSSYYVNEKFGFFLPSLFNNGNKTIHSIFEPLYLEKDEVSEKIRLLYVALTRAEEEAIIPLFNIIDEENQVVIEDDEDDIDSSIYLNKDDTLKRIENSKKMNQIMFSYDFKKKFNNFDKKEFHEEKTNNDSIYTNDKIEFKSLNYEFKEKINNRASKVANDVDNNALEFGNRLHLYMELVDLNSKDTSFIKNKHEKELIDKILKNEIFFDLKNKKIYKEYEYIDNVNEINGIIDLMIEDNSSIIIIDYKAKNIDDIEYSRQLLIYKDYIERVFNKDVKCYLLSLIDNKLKEVF